VPGRPSCLCSARAPPSKASAASQGSDRPHSPTKARSTSPCTYYSPPTRSHFPPSCHLAGDECTAASNGRRRRTTSPVPPRPQPRVEIEPREPQEHPTPVPDRPLRRSSPEFRRPRRPPPKDHIARPQFFPRTDPETEGVSVRNQESPGSFSQNAISNSKVLLLKLVKYVENRSKIIKMQTQFCWTLLQLLLFLPELFTNTFGMKNRSMKNVDLRYVKNHKSYVANFWICCVLGHE
jgi:hypothetical protein